MKNLIFKELNLSHEVQKALSQMGFEEATPIQSKSIPYIMEGRDILGQAQTGTGKTCAFGIPAIEMIDLTLPSVQVLVLCPTRELAIQVAEELKNVSKFKKGLRILPIYGGQSIDRQIMALKNKPQIIVGTPGRVMDHMRRRTLKLANLKMLILDEADEMLNMGFREDIDVILQDLPTDRQTLLFSATISSEIKEITKLYQKNPEHVVTVQKELTIPSIEQFYLEVRESSKLELLCRLVDAKNIKLGIVFCNTKKRVDELTSSLQARGYSAESLHGDMKQTERDRVMTKFRKGQIEILVATDVAARGIDVNDIEAVFNYDIPSDEEYYVHRIGRTGRAGKKGVSYSFVFGRDIYKLKDIQRFTKSEILPMRPPSISDVEEVKLDAAVNQVVSLLEDGGYSKYHNAIEKILTEADDVTSLDVAAALFKLAFDELDRSYEVSDLDDEASYYRKDGMVRLFMNVGTMDKIQPKNIVQGIASKSSLSGKLIGAIDIHKQFTFVEVPEEYADEVMASMRDFTHRGRLVSVEKAGKRQRPKGNKGRGSKKRY
ncbi:DEAD/DEAH box helicase [Sinanaerobacter chloroacetimidivorans]|uniref:ATP-dependent RNA helicase CshA n=1 Tax=Sinanaerobacter chloroacetimidivorans TaxID=2818044 RepID=A0A8J8B2K7_9FIRM|nr:DEAD/DEAH box helicase [Sinanaerobacter chloroacetimidivorans]MBR0598837.1 DEAD/DEAH box helicase [Sinanaerobacter chloroacetimidivorans]